MTANRIAHATSTPIDRSTLPHSVFPGLLAAARAAVTGIVAAVSGMVDGAQLGPASDVDVSRHSGSRI